MPQTWRLKIEPLGEDTTNHGSLSFEKSESMMNSTLIHFFPSVHGNDGTTCSQIFIGKDTDYMFVYSMKKESHSFIALQDFGRKVGLPRSIKTDNAKTETAQKWTTWCREY